MARFTALLVICFGCVAIAMASDDRRNAFNPERLRPIQTPTVTEGAPEEPRTSIMQRQRCGYGPASRNLLLSELLQWRPGTSCLNKVNSSIPIAEQTVALRNRGKCGAKPL